MAGMKGMNTNMNGSGSEGGTNASAGMQGMMDQRAGYACALTYSYPHRFWTVTGQKTEKVTIQQEDSIHLMVSVWDKATGTYVLDTSPTVTISQDGETVTTLTPWTMLSQNMGFHTGDNVSLPGDGTYSVTVDVPPASTRRIGAFEGQFTRQRSFEYELDYSQQKLEEISFERFEQRAGERGAANPMKMEMMPLANAPKKAPLPGRTIDETTSGDGVFVITAVEDTPRLADGEKTYLAVSPRTPYNRYILPSMSLSAMLTRGSKTLFDGPLPATLDPELNYHYGAPVESIEPGDELALTVDAPPQVARHEGYETAFLEMPQMRTTV